MENALGLFILLGILFVYLLVIAVMAFSLWRIFVKAWRPGWAALIPIYNLVVLLEMTNKPIWWIVFFFIPFANIVVAVLMSIALAESFGKSAGFGIGLAFLGLIFFPLLAFGDAEYQGGRPAMAPAMY